MSISLKGFNFLLSLFIVVVISTCHGMKSQLVEKEIYDCSICLDSNDDAPHDDLIITACSHQFHRKCLKASLDASASTRRLPLCQICRQSLSASDLQRMEITLNSRVSDEHFFGGILLFLIINFLITKKTN